MNRLSTLLSNSTCAVQPGLPTPSAAGSETRGTAWDASATGGNKRERHEYRGGARRFAKAGGTVEVVVAKPVLKANEDAGEEWTLGEGAQGTIGCKEEGCLESKRWSMSPDSDTVDNAALEFPVPEADGCVELVAEASGEHRWRCGLGGSSAGGVVGMRAATEAAMRWTGKYGGAGCEVPAAAGCWRLLEARVGGERAGLLLLHFCPERNGGACGRGGNTDIERRRGLGDVLGDVLGVDDTAAHSRVVLHACWLHPTLAKRHGVLFALLRGRGFYSFTSHLNLSRSCHLNTLKPPRVSVKECSRQAEKWTSANPCCGAPSSSPPSRVVQQ